MQQSTNICAYCGYANRRGVLFCEECAHPMSNASNETIPGRESVQRIWEALEQKNSREHTRFERESLLLLHIRNEPEPLAIAVGTDRLLVGRFDGKASRQVDIDLTSYGALKKGVSRLHAAVFLDKHDYPYLEDMNSANGTYLNGSRLNPREAYPVQDGDEITFGNLRTHAYFQTPAVTSRRS